MIEVIRISEDEIEIIEKTFSFKDTKISKSIINFKKWLRDGSYMFNSDVSWACKYYLPKVDIFIEAPDVGKDEEIMSKNIKLYQDRFDNWFNKNFTEK